MGPFDSLWRRLGGIAATVVAAMLSSVAIGKEVTEYFPDGAKRLVYNVNAANERDGAFAEFFPDGKKKLDASFKDGQLHGVCKEFFADGQLAKQIAYRDGVRNGPSVFWSEDRKTHEVNNFRNDKLHGTQQDFVGEEIVKDQYFLDGKLLYPNSAGMIAKYLAKIRSDPIELVGDEPAVPEVFRAGYDDPAIHAKRVAALRVLKAYRMLCGVRWNGMQLERGRVAYAQAAAELVKRHGELDHDPPNPGLEEAAYEFALFGTTHTNLSWGSSLGKAVHSWMNDSDPKNVDDIGHRRWCLDPAMEHAGFGEASSFAAMWSIETIRKPHNADVVAYPGRGLMPMQFFSGDRAWSVSLSPDHFAPLDKERVKAEIYPAKLDLEEGRIETAAEPLPLDVHLIGGGGQWDYCLIFRPAGFKVVRGTSFVVRVTGLTDLAGAEKNLEYVVSFYRA